MAVDALDLVVLGAATAFASGIARTLVENALQALFVGMLRMCGLYYDDLSNINDTENTRAVRRLAEFKVWALQPAVSEDALGTMLIFNAWPLIVGWVVRPSQRSSQDRPRSLMVVWSASTRAHFMLSDQMVAASVDTLSPLSPPPPVASFENVTHIKWTSARFHAGYTQKCTLDVAAPVLSWRRLETLIDNVYDRVSAGGAILLCGAAGVGKSSMAIHLAVRFRQRDTQPILLSGVSLMASTSFEALIDEYGVSSHRPLIIVLDEFCSMVKGLQSGANKDAYGSVDPRRRWLPVASNKAELSTFLDTAARCRHLIIVATSNETLEWWQREHEYVVRDGRFDARLAVDAPSLDDLNEACAGACARAGITPVPRLVATPPLGALSRAFLKDRKNLGASLAKWT